MWRRLLAQRCTTVKIALSVREKLVMTFTATNAPPGTSDMNFRLSWSAISLETKKGAASGTTFEYVVGTGICLVGARSESLKCSIESERSERTNARSTERGEHEQQRSEAKKRADRLFSSLCMRGHAVPPPVGTVGPRSL